MTNLTSIILIFFHIFYIIENHIFQLHSKSYHSIKFKIISFNAIQNNIFQWNSKSYHLITFKNISFNEIQNHIFQQNFDIIIIYKTALYLAVENENIEIVKLLLMNDKLDINVGYIFHIFYIIGNLIFQLHSKSYLSKKFKVISFNYIQNYIFQLHSKSYLSIEFKIISFNGIQNHIFQ